MPPAGSRFFSSHPAQNPYYLGLLGRIVLNTVLIEPYRNSPNRSEVRNCVVKLFTNEVNEGRRHQAVGRRVFL
jgi:hypothetical protein